MTNEEIVTKIRNSGRKDPEDMLQLFQQNKGLVMKLIQPFARYSEEARAPGDFWCKDLQHEVFLSLYEAVDAFDPERGASFVTFWVPYARRALMRYAGRSGGICFSEDARLEVLHYRKTLRSFLREYGRDPSDEELLRFGDWPDMDALRRVQKLAALQENVSLDEPRTEDGDTLGDLQPAPGPALEDAVTDRLADEQLKAELWKAVDELPADNAEVIRRKYQDGQTSKQISEALGVSITTVSNRHGRACDLIRKSARAPWIQELYDSMPIWEKQSPYSGSLMSWKRSGYSRPERLAIWSVDGDV